MHGPSSRREPDERDAASRHFEARTIHYRHRCLGYLKALEEAFRPESVHKLRTHLRRLQSYAEFLEDISAAERLGEAVSWFSRLRSLSELRRYLRRSNAAAKDVRRVEKALRKEQKAVRKAVRTDAVRRLLAEIRAKDVMRPTPDISDRLARLHLQNRTILSEALLGLSSNPKRKELHQLRLRVKSLRYQQEIAAELGWGNPRTVEALKRLQGVLGKYCDRHQFTRMAKELRLTGYKKIKKDRRRSRKQARRVVLKLKSKQAQPVQPLHSLASRFVQR